VTDKEKIRRAFYIEGKSRRQIARELHHSYWTIRKALVSGEHKPYQLSKPKPAPKLDKHKETIETMLAEEATLPRKQRYTSRNIYESIAKEGYSGSESNLRRYVGRRRRELKQKRPEIYIPLSFQPGQDAQVDWGEGVVIMAGERRKVELFVLRLCYSRRPITLAYPTQRQEAFFQGHIEAFGQLGGVPQTLTYDNLKTAVHRILTGRNRQEQNRFIELRSHYLFESRYCTPAQGHEKGGVEHGVKYVRQNFLTPLVSVADFGELNHYLKQRCQADMARQVARQTAPIAEMFAQERPHLRPLPPTPYASYVTREVVLNKYGQVTFETNRYSVPAVNAHKQLTLHIYPFRIEIWHQAERLAIHERSYEREQDSLNPYHYLPLLAQRPGAFDHARPLQTWRKTWPAVYERFLDTLQRTRSRDLAVKEFIQVLQLHDSYAMDELAQAMEAALADGIAHREGVLFCLNRLRDATPVVTHDGTMSDPTPSPWKMAGTPPVPATQYDQLLGQYPHMACS